MVEILYHRAHLAEPVRRVQFGFLVCKIVRILSSSGYPLKRVEQGVNNIVFSILLGEKEFGQVRGEVAIEPDTNFLVLVKANHGRCNREVFIELFIYRLKSPERVLHDFEQLDFGQVADIT